MRSKIDANEYKDYILGPIFYKFLSDNEVNYLRGNGWTDETVQPTGNDLVNSRITGMWQRVASVWQRVALKYGITLTFNFTEITCKYNHILIIFAENLAINEKSHFERMGQKFRGTRLQHVLFRESA